MPYEYWYLFVLSLISALVATPLCRRVAIRWDITDRPDGRKTHRRPVPYLGGVAFWFSVLVSLGYLFLFSPYVLDDPALRKNVLLLFGIASAFHVLGIVDDGIALSAIVKLLIEIVLSIILVRFGFSLAQVTSPLGGVIPAGWWGDFLSVLWILTIVNAINFIDGLDGLAAGIVFFAALANLMIALSPWQPFVCIVSLMLMGMTLGFLPYNFSPAKIFMGDAGSLFLGVLLGGSALASNVKGATVMSLSLPLVILSIPLLDTVLAVVRRSKSGFHLFRPDRRHIHHRLLSLGFSDRQAVLCLYGLCFLFAMSAVLAAQLPDQYTLLFILVFLAAVAWGITVFSVIETRIEEKLEPAQTEESNPPPTH